MMRILLLGRDQDSERLREDLATFGDVSICTCLDDISYDSFDLAISYCFGPILKQVHIDMIGCRIVNVHPSFLPYGRGIYPILWSSVQDEPLGCSLHLIENQEIDRGLIVDQQREYINESVTLRQAHSFLMSASRSLLLKNICNGNIFKESSEYISPEQNIASKSYKSRKVGNALLSCLEEGWDTTIRSAKMAYVMHRSQLELLA